MGYLRFILAVTVTISHLWTVKVAGHVAVFGFYCISGFLMTKVIHETYGSSWRGKISFLINRAIRIYPTYYLCLCIAIICLYLVPEAYKINSALTLPKSWGQWFPQLFIFGLNGMANSLPLISAPHVYPIRLLPPAWSLNIELVNYLWMCLIIGTSLSRTVAWGFASVCISIYLFWNHSPYDYHYATFYNTSICFVAGALAYHAAPFIKFINGASRRNVLIAGGVLAYIPILFGFAVESHPSYLYVTIFAYIYILICLGKSKPMGKIEQLLADLSYPLFLLHWPVAALCMHLLMPKTTLFWAAATGLSLVLSFLIVKITDAVFLPVRKRIRSQAKAMLA